MKDFSDLNLEKCTKIVALLLGDQVVLDGEALGSHKRVLYFKPLKGHSNVFTPNYFSSWALILAIPRGAANLESSLVIQNLLATNGVPISTVLHKDIQGHLLGFPFVLVERMKGMNIDNNWNHLQEKDVPIIACQIANIIYESQKLFPNPPQHFGVHLANHLPEQSNLYDRFLWLMRRAYTVARFKRNEKMKMLASSLETLLASQETQTLLAKASVSTFVLDLLDRNFFIERGKVCGIVDVDELMTGDIWLLPATADVFLAMIDFKYRELYIKTWVNLWNPTTDDMRRMELYRAIMAVERQSLAGTLTSTGQPRGSVPEALLKEWVDNIFS